MELPEDMISEILSWMPAKSVCKFKSCSKSISEITAETKFALKQAQNLMLTDDSCFFIQPDIQQRKNYKIEIHPLPGQDLTSGVPEKFMPYLSRLRILASSNGLLLCRTTRKCSVNLYICNPATLSWLPIPVPEHVKKTPNEDINVAFECKLDCWQLNSNLTFSEILPCLSVEPTSINDYTIVLIEPTIDLEHLSCKVYMPEERKWKTAEKSLFSGSRSLILDFPVLHNGAIHFVSDCLPYVEKTSPYFWPYIMSYNLETGISKMLRVPKGSHDKRCEMRIFKWSKVARKDESICLVRLRTSEFNIWVLTDYECSCWRRILNASIRAIFGLKKKDPVPTITGFAVMNGDVLVFSTKEKVYGYGLRGENYGRLKEYCEHGFKLESRLSFTSYSNTLRPLP